MNMKRFSSYAVVALIALGAPTAAAASSIVVSVGNTAPTDPFNGGAPLVSGNTYGSAVVISNFVAPFFTGLCGGSEVDPNPVNCDKSWTFNYVIPAGDTITAASLTLGILDIDSTQAGTQVALYQVNGGDVLTSALNTAAEALNGGTGSINSQYDVFTFALSNFGALSGGSATIHLTLSGPGGTLFGPTTANTAAVFFSTLNITTTAASTQPPTVPEPASLLLVATGLAAAARSRMAARLKRPRA